MKVDLLYYKCHEIGLNRAGSYIDSPKWFKNKKTTISPKNNDDKCFQYSIAAALINPVGDKQTFHHIKMTGKNSSS